MNILIVGGSGFLGGHLIDCWDRPENCLYLWVHHNEPKIPKFASYQFISFDTQSVSDIQLDLVINLAGIPLIAKKWSSDFKAKLSSSRVLFTKQLNQYCQNQGFTVSHYIGGSAIGLYPDQTHLKQDDRFECDEMQLGDNSFMSLLCQNWEEEHLNFSADIKSIIRTGLVLDAEQGYLKALLLPAKLYNAATLGSGQQIQSWIHYNDWLKACEFIADQKIIGSVNLVAPQITSQKEFQTQLASLFNYKPFLLIPAWVLKLIMGARCALLLEGAPVVPKKLLDNGFSFQFSHLKDALNNLLKS